jgi:glycosyltransferase involved in cell wall biosynthesis
MILRPAAGGMKEHVLALALGLERFGHEVEIAAPGDSDVFTASRAAGLMTHDIPLVGPLHPIKDPAAIAAVRRLVAAGEFDLIHAHGFKAGFVGRLATRLAGGRPFIVTAHNHVLERDETSGGAKARYRVVERALAGYVTRYIAVSESIRRELLEGYGLPGQRVVTIHNGIDAAPFLVPRDRAAARAELGLPDDVPVVGLAARFSSQKGLRHLIAALPELRRGEPRALAVIGGSGPLESELREQASALEVREFVRWPGHVDDIPGFLCALDVYVSPAETEALGIGLIEASAAAVPIVATAVGGVAEVVVDGVTGMLVAPRDPRALARAILGLLGDRERALRLAAAARERAVLEFTVERMVELTVQTYDSAIAEWAEPR